MNRNLIASIIFAFGFVMFFVLVLPQYDAVSFAKDNLKSKQALADERSAEIANFKTLDREAKLRQADIDRIIAFLPPQKQVDQLVSSIQQVSADSGMQMTNLSSSEVTGAAAEAKQKTISISVDLNGPYPSFVTFLGLLEQNLRLYDISEIAAGTSLGAAQGAVNFSIKLNAYYLK